MKTKDIFKSRTVNAAWAAPAIIAIFERFGITISATEAAAIMGFLFFVLRLITETPIGGQAPPPADG